MGCRTSKTGAPVVVVQPPEDPVKIRLRLRGDTDPEIGDTILAKICEITDQFANRFEIAPTEKKDVYFTKVLPMEGDASGTIGKLCRQIIGQAVGKGIHLNDNCKIIGAKEYVEAGDL